ncbi:helix-turn-helix domain-containing protein [Porphyromonas gingivicanis]|uniref:helix-turn-helix domain-containing protein n=1 Tax=Porphyromonas gingivicanis TaxID=266762 RepID=UPI00047060E0|nr:helix-turn-helix domain-containing protein [Porphyromonas gingivicanis]
MEHEIVNRETPEMKELISGIREMTKRLKEIAETHRPLFGGEIYLTGREVCERLFISPRTLQDYRDKGVIPYTQIAGKILYRLSDIDQLLQENYKSTNKISVSISTKYRLILD